MDPISVALLAAMAGGLGGEAGRQAWDGLAALVRRPFRRGDADPDTDGTDSARSGERELTQLAQAPDDTARAHALSTALAVRAALDADFRRGLEDWWEQARRTAEQANGGVNNRISGGTYYGPVIQSRDISGGSFAGPPPPPTPPPPPPPSAGG